MAVTSTSRWRAVLVGDALLPVGVISRAFQELDDLLEITAELNFGGPDEEGLDRLALQLEREGPEAVAPPAELAGRLQDADILVVHYCPVPASLVKSAPRLRLIATCRMGTENLDLEAAKRAGISVLHVVGRTTEAVSDFAIGLLLAEARNIARAHHRLRSGRWDKSFPNSSFTPELEGQVLGLVGFGEIGRAVARKLAGFRMRILSSDPYQPEEQIRAAGAEPVELEQLLRDADFVSLHARIDQGQPPLLGRPQLALMKQTAVLINTARANLVDTAALAEALRRHALAGAALDVHDEEPLPPDHPLLELDNVTLTPHLASSTLACTEKSPRLLATEVRDVIEGREAKHLVSG